MRLSAIALAAVLLPGVAMAQGGHIGLYSDYPGLSDCNLQVQVGVSNLVYVAHELRPEAVGSQFKVVNSWGTGVFFGGVNYHGNVHIGDIFTGVAVTYVGCKPLPHLIATLTFIPLFEYPPCTALSVVADPVLPSGQIEAVDCSNIVLAATGGVLCINTPLCCILAGPQPGPCSPIATEPSTWGGIKALYR